MTETNEMASPIDATGHNSSILEALEKRVQTASPQVLPSTENFDTATHNTSILEFHAFRKHQKILETPQYSIREVMGVDEASHNSVMLEEDHNIHSATIPILRGPPIDHGWAWVICITSMLQRSIIFGTLRGNGVLFSGVVEVFEVNYENITWISTIAMATLTTLSPVANVLAEKFTARRVIFVGGLVCFLAHVLSCVASNVILLYFSYGILLGTGIAMVHNPSVIMVAQYFSRRRSLACGIAMSGAPIGGSLIPEFIAYLLEAYGVRGTFLVMGGVQLQLCVLASLSRPFSFYVGDKPARMSSLSSLSTPQMMHQNCARRCFTKTTHTIRHSLKWSLWTSPFYVGFALAIGLSSMGKILSFLILPLYAKEIGLTNTQGAHLAVWMALPDLLSRLVTGHLADRMGSRTKRTYAYFVAVFLHAGVWFTMKLTGDFGFYGLMVLAMLLGMTAGSLSMLYPVLLVDWFGLENLKSALGFSMFLEGMAFVITPEYTGRLKDLTGTWIYAGYGIGSLMLCAALILAVIYFARKIYNTKNEVSIDAKWKIYAKEVLDLGTH